MPFEKYMIHAEWKERVPGQLLLQPRERTVERMRRDFMDAYKMAMREFPGASITLRRMDVPKPELKTEPTQNGG